MLFETRTDTTVDTDTQMVREETRIRQEYHAGQVIELKEATYITEVTQEVAALKASQTLAAPIGTDLTAMISGGGIGAALLAFAAKKLWDRKPPAEPRPAPVKGRKEEDD